MPRELALQGLFRHLLRRGFPLTVRDYEDALKALESGYGLHRRQDLLWLCETLWARTEEEIRCLRLLFQQFPQPLAEEIEAVTGHHEENIEPGGEAGDGGISDATSSPETADQVPVLQFTAPAQTGLGLPQARVTPSRETTFILTPHPIASLRSLIIIWRRFRRALRTGPLLELDIPATIDEQCRRGILTEPVLLPVRRNLARLVVLVDTSPSMRPWQSFNTVLAESLQESGLGMAALYYFHNVPRKRLFFRATLTRPIALDEALRRHPDSTLLVISDAGAARGHCDRGRIQATEKFLSEIATHWQTVAWVNPMPQRRWRQTSARDIADFPGLSMFELNEDGLIQAVDVLRGYRSH